MPGWVATFPFIRRHSKLTTYTNEQVKVIEEAIHVVMEAVKKHLPSDLNLTEYLKH